METLKKKVKAVDGKIDAINSEVTDLERSNLALLESNLLSERKPASLAVQRQKLEALNQALDEHKKVKVSLGSKLVEKQTALEYARIYERVPIWKKKEKEFDVKYDNIVSALKKLDAEIRNFKHRVDAFDVLEPQKELSFILSQLETQKDDICYSTFFETGEVLHKADRNADFIQKNAINRFSHRSLNGNLPEVADLNVIGEDLLNLFYVARTATDRLRDFV